MSQAAYEVFLDLDRDGFPCADVSASDALNLIYGGAQNKVGYSERTGSTISLVYELTAYGHHIYRCVTGTVTTGGIRFGATSGADSIIPVAASTAYRMGFWTRGVAGGYGSVPMITQVFDQGGTKVGEETFSLTANWQQITIEVTTAVASTHIRILILKAIDATDITFDTTGFMVVLGTTLPTVYNAGDYSNLLDNITTYVKSAEWVNGLQDSYQEFAPPARLTLVLDNSEGYFKQEGLGSELLTNGGPAFTFTSDDLDSWTETGESGSDPFVTQVGADEDHTGTGTGYVCLYTTSATIDIRQTILTIGERYEVTVNINKVTTGGIIFYSGTTVISIPYSTPGIKTFVFTASATSCIVRNFGACDVTIASVSVKLASRFYGLQLGLMAFIRASFGSITDQYLYMGKLVEIQLSVGAYGEKQVTATFEDFTRQLLNLNYSPPLQTDVMVNEGLDTFFDEALLALPYTSNYWVLGVDGASNLNLNTILFDNAAFTDFDTGITEIAYVGDYDSGGDSETKAQSFLRDLIAAEMGGRFFFDSRTGKFTFHSRHRDLLNDTVIESLTHDDAESADYRYGDDVVNQVTVTFQPREVGASAIAIWEAGNLPLEIAPGQSKTITARYRDPAQTDAKIGAFDFITPVADTDYRASTSETSLSNGNRTSVISLSVEFGGSSAKVTIINHDTRAQAAFINLLQLRGTPIYTYDKQYVNVQDGDSLLDNDPQPQPINLPLVSSQIDAQSYAEFYVSARRKRLGRMASIAFNANKTTARMERTLSAAIGNRYAYTDSYTGHDADYITVGERHSLTPGGEHTHNVTWILKPITRQTFWVLGVTGKSELGSTTVLAF